MSETRERTETTEQKDVNDGTGRGVYSIQEAVSDNSFILCVCGLRTHGGVRQDPPFTAETATRDGPAPQTATASATATATAPHLVHYHYDRIGGGVLSLCEVRSNEVIA